jgi:general secretion pathway protein J
MTHARGFTLIEVMVAMVLLTLFTIVAYRALDAVLNTQREATARMNGLDELSTAFALMGSDLSNAVQQPNPGNPNDSGFHVTIGQDGSEQFDFVRLMPTDSQQAIQRTGYRCAGDTLSRLVWPDADLASATPKRFSLLAGLQACVFKYLNVNGQWLNVWLPQLQYPFPRAVEIDITTADGTPIRRIMGVQ